MTMSDVGVWFESLIDPLLDFLRLEGIGPFLAVVIIFSAFFVLLWATWRFYTFRRELIGALGVLKVVKEPISFLKHYEKIEGYFTQRRSSGFLHAGGSLLKRSSIRISLMCPLIRGGERNKSFEIWRDQESSSMPMRQGLQLQFFVSGPISLSE